VKVGGGVARFCSGVVTIVGGADLESLFEDGPSSDSSQADTDLKTFNRGEGEWMSAIDG